MYTIKWNGDTVSILDQRLLPMREVYSSYAHYAGVANSIKDMEIRGAPAIGVAAAMGIALAAKNIHASNIAEYKEELNRACSIFAASRPTAVNLFWAINKMKAVFEKLNDIPEIKERLEKEAIRIYEEDIQINRTIGKNGSKYISDGDVVMTHCNAGALATAGYGTALGVIRAAVEEGKKIHVYACETRPYLQGARLTAWELSRDNIPVTVITDNMAGYFMKSGTIRKIIVGADRIAVNGDTANKIGTYTHSVLAKEHRIPFYVAAPVSTIDAGIANGDAIPIEERGGDEVAFVQNIQIVPEGVFIKNPSFDVTPAKNISAIITEKGVIENPAEKGMSSVLNK